MTLLPTSSSRISGLQRDVFSLYRRVLRQALEKDRMMMFNTSPSTLSVSSSTTTSTSNTTILPLSSLLQQSDTMTSYAKQEFRRQAKSVSRSDFKRIEYLLRQGKKQLTLFQMPGIRRVVRTS